MNVSPHICKLTFFCIKNVKSLFFLPASLKIIYATAARELSEIIVKQRINIKSLISYNIHII